jgi:hypothetical protein
MVRAQEEREILMERGQYCVREEWRKSLYHTLNNNFKTTTLRSIVRMHVILLGLYVSVTTPVYLEGE